MRRAGLVFPCLLLSAALQWSYDYNQPNAPHSGVVAFIWAVLVVAFCMPALLPGLLLGLVFGLDAHRLAPWALIASPLFWFFPVGRIRRLFGAYDPLAAKDRPRPLLLRGAVFLLDEADKRFFGRQKSGGWA